MNVGDIVRVRKFGVSGTVAEIDGIHILVKTIDFTHPIMFYASELELLKPAAVVNPCVVCGAETPEGFMVCRQCRTKHDPGAS